MDFDDFSSERYNQLINGYCHFHKWSVQYGVFGKVANSRASCSGYSGLLLILMIFHYKSMVSLSYNHCYVHQFIIQSLLCSSVKFPIGSFQNCAKFILKGTWHFIKAIGISS